MKFYSEFLFREDMKFNLAAQTSERNKKSGFRHHQYMVFGTNNEWNKSQADWYTQKYIESVFC